MDALHQWSPQALICLGMVQGVACCIAVTLFGNRKNKD